MAGRQIEVRRVSTLNVTTVVEPPVAFRLGLVSRKCITSLGSSSFATSYLKIERFSASEEMYHITAASLRCFKLKM
jgi:hypothetical protein